jgi:hypothetical protein
MAFIVWGGVGIAMTVGMAKVPQLLGVVATPSARIVVRS